MKLSIYFGYAFLGEFHQNEPLLKWLTSFMLSFTDKDVRGDLC